MVTDRRENLRGVEVDEVGVPVGATVARQQRGVRGEAHDVAVALEAGQAGRLGDRRAQRPAALVVVGGVLADVDLRLAAVVAVVALQVVPEPLRRLVVMFVHHLQLQFVGDPPPVVIVLAVGERAHRADDHDLRVLGLHGLVDHLETFPEDRRDAVLVADAEVLQAEWPGVAGGGALGAPGRGGGAIGPLDQVEHVLDVGRHFVQRQALLAFAPLVAVGGAGVLAANAGRHHRQGFRADVLAELEVLEVAEADALVVPPDVRLAAALLERADGVLPAVQVAEAVAMDEAAAGKAHEPGLQVGDCLGEVGAQAVRPVLEGLLREQRNHVEPDAAAGLGQHDEAGVAGILLRLEHGGRLRPIRPGGRQGGLGEHRAGGGLKPHRQRATGPVELPGEQREVVLVARLHRDAVETQVAQAHPSPALFDAEDGVLRVGGVERFLVVDGQGALGAGQFDSFPGDQRVPSLAVGRRILERPVLDQLGIEPAVGRPAEVLEEDAHEVGTDRLAGGAGLHGDGRPLGMGRRGQPDRKGDQADPGTQGWWKVEWLHGYQHNGLHSKRITVNERGGNR